MKFKRFRERYYPHNLEIKRRSPRLANLKKKKKLSWKNNKGFFGPIMNKNGILNRDEICHNCTTSAYEYNARKFCKEHHKVWNRKNNSCRIKKSKKKTSKKPKTRNNSLQTGGGKIAFVPPP